MFCSKCGNQIKAGVKFCKKCGTPVVAENVNAPITTLPPPSLPPIEAQESPKKKAIKGLLIEAIEVLLIGAGIAAMVIAVVTMVLFLENAGFKYVLIGVAALCVVSLGLWFLGAPPQTAPPKKSSAGEFIITVAVVAVAVGLLLVFGIWEEQENAKLATEKQEQAERQHQQEQAERQLQQEQAERQRQQEQAEERRAEEARQYSSGSLGRGNSSSGNSAIDQTFQLINGQTFEGKYQDTNTDNNVFGLVTVTYRFRTQNSSATSGIVDISANISSVVSGSRSGSNTVTYYIRADGSIVAGNNVFERQGNSLVSNMKDDFGSYVTLRKK